jgi:uncharacterized protein (DUF433 family)
VRSSVSRELVRRIQEDTGVASELSIVVLRNNQLVLSEEASRYQDALDFRDGVAVRLRPQRVSPRVRMDPERAFGRPAIRGVTTEVLAEDYRAGAGTAELADLYDLEPGEIEDALRFEMTQRGAA